MRNIFLTFIFLFGLTSLVWGQTPDSASSDGGMRTNPESQMLNTGPTSPLLNADQLKREKWFYSITDAMREPEKVFKLSLKDTKLKTFPAEIMRFTNLQVLNLADNKLKEIPEEISMLEHLEILILVGNKIRNLPDGVRDLDNLRELYIGSNRLSEIPAWVGGLSKLRTLDVSYNGLTPYEIELLKYRLPKCTVTH
ncbi:MAG: leucine-rich repeat domain-containing protein [Bacteroidetes bacterium]|nr:leucine-rich repeat domain-containing protein [Bacteroidota bacterium]MCB0847168.1 leucine-rich repeat domain-containing protein [Bacteroidota bacterium]